MATDRDEGLRRAEKLERGGQLDAAIAEYLRLVDTHPRDWALLNALGDLYVRAGMTERALVPLLRIAKGYQAEGFYAKAAAFCKKVLKLAPGHEEALMSLADAAVAQGLKADARACLEAVAAARRRRNDAAGLATVLGRLADLEPRDLALQVMAAQVAADPLAAASRLRQLAAELEEDGKTGEALTLWREVLSLDASDRETRLRVARAAFHATDLATAAALLAPLGPPDRSTPFDLVSEVQLRTGQFDAARETLLTWLRVDPVATSAISSLAERVGDAGPEPAYLCVEALVHAALAQDDVEGAAQQLRAFLCLYPRHIPALTTLVQVAAEGHLDTLRSEGQLDLAEAYLEDGQPGRARVVAEDLVARAPDDPRFKETLDRAARMLGETRPGEQAATPAEGGDLSAAATETRQDAGVALAQDAGASSPTEPALPVAPRETAREVEIDLTDRLDELATGAVDEATVAESAIVPARTADETPAVGGEDMIEVSPPARPVGDTPGAPGSTEALLDLGRAYQARGQTAEAIEAFRAATRNPLERYEAAVALAQLHEGRSDLNAAVEWFEEAAEAAPTPAKRGAVLYRLGRLLEHVGEPARALAVLMELQAMVPAFRDVNERVARLTERQAGGGPSSR